MNVLQVSFKNIWFKKTLSLLTILAVSAASALVVFIILIDKGIERGAAKGYEPFELVIGAEGSNTQLVLNTFYHIGAPTGNIDYSVYEEIISSNLAENAYPVTRGDNYKGFAMVGTPFQYFSTRYPDASFEKGTAYKKAGEVVIGYHAAEQLELDIGDQFHSSHGAVNSNNLHNNLLYTVVGILPKLGTPDDKAIFTSLDAAWIVHGEEGHEEVSEEQEHSQKSGDITAILIKPAGLVELQSLKNKFDDREGIQAAYSSRALSSVLTMVDTGAKVITLIASVSILIAAISIILSLSAMAAERQKDIGLIRLLGKPKSYVFYGVLIEGAGLTIIGAMLGVVVGHIGSFLLRNLIFEYAGIDIEPFKVLPAEGYIVVAAGLIGIIASLLPAIRAYRVNPLELF